MQEFIQHNTELLLAHKGMFEPKCNGNSGRKRNSGLKKDGRTGIWNVCKDENNENRTN